MNFLIISYGVIEQDGRLNELIASCKRVGAVSVVGFTLLDTQSNSGLMKIESGHERWRVANYFRFIYRCLRAARTQKIEILFVDDFAASLAGLILFWMIKPDALIQDSREFYFAKKMPGLGRILLFFERILYRRADLIICANRQRARLMKKAYELPRLPYVFENIRTLNAAYDGVGLAGKYQRLPKEKFKLISTGGCSVARGTARLVRAMNELPDCFLYIVGYGAKGDYEEISKILVEEKIKNVEILEKVSLGELRYLVQRCDLGVVEYHCNDLNNKYCASGKIYEYVAEGVPVVTTPNLPLAEICKKNQVGVADDDVLAAIRQVKDNIQFYRKNAKNMALQVSVESNNEKLAKRIEQALSALEGKNI